MRRLPEVARRMRQLPWRWLSFPSVILVLFLVLVAANLSGSSIALLSRGMPDNGLIAGTPRAVRSDEWVLRTPIAISSVAQGYPAKPWIGLNVIDQPATPHAGPTRDWSTIVKPQDWGYVLLGRSRGLAASWWWSFAVCLVGCFALIGFLTRRPLASAALAIAATFTPYAGWWTAPPPSLFVGYAALTAVCVLAAWSARRRWAGAGWALAAGLFAVMFVLPLYPPWQVSLGWVVAALCVGHVLDARIAWRRVLWPLGVAAVVAGVLLGTWFAQHHDAIRAQEDTYYPGHRVSVAGTASLRSLLDAPLNFWMSGGAGTTMGINGRGGPYANLSEAASTWLPLALGAVLLIGFVQLVVEHVVAVVRRRRDGQQVVDDDDGSPGAPIWTATLVSLSVVLIVVWALCPLPSYVGRLTALQRVQPSRTPLALGFGLVLLIACAVATSGRRPSAWSWPWLTLSALAAAGTAVWSDNGLPWDAGRTPTLLVALSGLALGAVFAGIVYPRARIVSGLALAIYVMASWLPINPLQHGIAPISRDPLVHRLALLAARTDDRRVAVFADPRNAYVTVAKVRAAGMQSLSGTTPYPDASLMARLVPAQKNLWNNYAQYAWAVEPDGTPPFIRQLHGTAMELHVSACDPILLRATRPGWVVSDHVLVAPCIAAVRRVTEDNGQPFWIYRVRR